MFPTRFSDPRLRVKVKEPGASIIFTQFQSKNGYDISYRTGQEAGILLDFKLKPDSVALPCRN